MTSSKGPLPPQPPLFAPNLPLLSSFAIFPVFIPLPARHFSPRPSRLPFLPLPSSQDVSARPARSFGQLIKLMSSLAEFMSRSSCARQPQPRYTEPPPKSEPEDPDRRPPTHDPTCPPSGSSLRRRFLPRRR